MHLDALNIDWWRMRIKSKFGPGKYHLEQKKLKRAKLILSSFSIPDIIEKSLYNLKRWQANDVWCSAYTEWQEIMEGGDSEMIRDAMIGDSERSARLRQSPPYVGLLSEEEVMMTNMYEDDPNFS